ncbi:cysteine desulfurase-like protein [Aquibacillus albus]|uniref:Cysteine desulfurase family protein (TIGR01976 family) n=1 Tax=Aquibacillus albus TaxID=1168171 RepID=A0ABS2N2C8_9BACI|nr:cysteine desulfurase-like protein [Aquibacillus albus]MBM7572285.1 cysteine desulfurase family protein (TIGR01976 family) [Aquibacillus albus]
MNQNLVTFPVETIREQFPALKRQCNGKSAVYFDGPGGSQVVQSSIEAITSYMRNGGANLHGAFPSSVETEHTIEEARKAVGDLLGVKDKEVAFGANMTTLAFSIARALAKGWKQGDEIVVTELDHRANVDPWITVANDLGLKIRWIKVDPQSLTLQYDELHELINENTKLVAIGLASNAVGTINDVAKIATKAKEVGALVAVDAVHAVPHIPINRDSLQADILLCSAYKFFGPHIGIAAIKSDVFESLEPYKLVPAPSYIPDKLETGTQNHEGIAGIRPAIEFFANLGDGTSRRDKIISGIERVEVYENSLASKIRGELASLNKVTLYQADSSVPKTPTIAFQVKGITPEEVCRKLSDQSAIFIASGDFYATTLANKLGINKSGGWIRAGLAPYNTEKEANHFIEAIKQL